MTDTTVRSVSVRLDADVARYIADMRLAGRETDRAFSRGNTQAQHLNTSVNSLNSRVQVYNNTIQQAGNSSQRAGNQIDTLSGRVKLLLQGAAVIGPAFLPISAVAIPALVGLTTQLGFVVAGAGATILAVQGMKDAFTALDKARLEPTTDNILAAQAAVQALGPDAEHTVKAIYALRSEYIKFRDIAGAGIFPGVDSAIDDLGTRVPEIRAILRQVSRGVGDSIADAGDALASDKYDDFFVFLHDEAGPTIDAVSGSVGHLAHGFASLLVGLAPLTRDFNAFLLSSTGAFDSAATNGDYSDFIDYVRTNGPQVADTLLAVAHAGIEIADAVSPLGGPSLQIIEGFANAVAGLADSDLGTPILGGLAALSLLSRATAIYGAVSRSTAGQVVAGQRGVQSAYLRSARAVTGLVQRSSAASLGRGLALAGAIAIASTGAADSVGLTNTASLTLAGSLAGPYGAAVGAALGLTLDLAHANDDLQASLDAVDGSTRGVSLKQLQAQQDELLANYNKIANADGFKGNFARIGSFLSGDVDEFEAAYNDLQDSIDAASAGATGIGGLLGQPFNLAADAADLASQSVKAYTTTVTESLNVLQGRATYRAYQASLDDFTEALKKNGRTLDNTTPKGRAVAAALDQIANSALDYSKRLRGFRRVDYLDTVRDQYVAAAVAAGQLPREAKAAATELGLLDKTNAKPKVDLDDSRFKGKLKNSASNLAGLNDEKIEPSLSADTSTLDSKVTRSQKLLDLFAGTNAQPTLDVNNNPALAGIGAVRNALAAVRDKTVVLTVQRRGAGSLVEPNARVTGPGSSADGSTVPHGGTYVDRHLYLLAPGEEVISNRYGQADRHRPLLKSINAGRLAGGGTVIGGLSLPTDEEIAAAQASGSTAGSKTSAADAKVAKSKAAAAAKKAKVRASLNKAATQSIARFDIDLKLDDNGLSSALDDFRDELGDVRDKFKAAHRDLDKGVERQLRAIKAQATAYDALTATLQQTRDAQQQLVGAAAGSINNDIFGNGLAGLGTQLDADTNDNRAFQDALAKAVANGLDGGLFAALAGSGDVTTAQQLAGLDPAGIAAYEAKFNDRAAAQQALGQFAGQTAYGAQVAQQTKAVNDMAAKIDRLEQRLPGAVRDGAREGTRDGSRQGSAQGTAVVQQQGNVSVTQATRTGSRGGGRRGGKGR